MKLRSDRDFVRNKWSFKLSCSQQPWTCHCCLKGKNSSLRAASPQGQAELGTWKGFHGHQWVWRTKNTALITSKGWGFFTQKISFASGVERKYFLLFPARVAAVIPCLQDRGMELLGCSPHLEMLYCCSALGILLPEALPALGAPDWAFYEPAELKPASVPLGCKGRENKPCWGGNQHFLWSHPFVPAALAGRVLKGQIFLKAQPGVYCFLITDLVPQIKGFTFLLYQKYAEYRARSSVISVKMSPTISSFY